MITTNLKLNTEITKTELCNLLGVKKATGGRNIKLQNAEFARFFKTEKVSRYKLILTEIYKNVVDKIDNRGKSGGSRNNNNPYGQYIDLLLREYIITEEKADFYVTTNILAKRSGLINNNYSYCTNNKRRYFQYSYREVNGEVNKTAMWDIFGIIKGILKGATHSALNRLQNAGAIEFEEAIIIIFNNNTRMASEMESATIQDCEDEILKDLETTKQKMQYDDRLRNKYYSEVGKLVKQKLDYFTSYFVGYKIHRLIHIKSELSKEEIIELRENANRIFRNRVKDSILKVHYKTKEQTSLEHPRWMGTVCPSWDIWIKNRMSINYLTYSDYVIDSLVKLNYKYIVKDVEETKMVEYVPKCTSLDIDETRDVLEYALHERKLKGSIPF